MKKYAILCFAVFFIALVPACKKKSNPFTYAVNGLTDITVVQNYDTTVTLKVAIAYQSGNKEKITVAIDTLPAGVDMAQSTASGTPDFTDTFSFHINVATPGTYPVTIKTSSPSTGSKTHKFNIIISPSTFAFTVNGFSDISVTQYVDTTVILPVTASFVSGTPENVTIVPVTLPAGVSVTPSSIAGIPTFSGNLSFHILAYTYGTLPVTIRATSPSTGIHNYSFNIFVSPNSNCAPGVAGSYTASDACAPDLGLASYAAHITTTSVANQVKIPLDFATITADLDCASGTFTTRRTLTADVIVTAGYGNIFADSIVVHYTVKAMLDSTLQNTCTTTLLR